MQLMDSKRPSGRVAVVLAGLLSLTCGWMAIASAPERETVAATPSEDNAPIVVTWQVADALIELGMLQVEEYDEHGGAVATLAASGGMDLSVLVVTGMEGDVIAPVPPGIAPMGPCIAPAVPGPGGRCMNHGWRLFDYPPPMGVSCARQAVGSGVWCTYEIKFVFLRLSTGCKDCADDEVCVEFAQYTWKCEQARTNQSDDPNGCECPPTPLGPEVGGCATPTLPPQNPGVSPGRKLKGFDMKTDKRCYKPGTPWAYE
jgi:hypothetical protein